MVPGSTITAAAATLGATVAAVTGVEEMEEAEAEAVAEEEEEEVVVVAVVTAAGAELCNNVNPRPHSSTCHASCIPDFCSPVSTSSSFMAL